jgi:hypothetical protein
VLSQRLHFIAVSSEATSWIKLFDPPFDPTQLRAIATNRADRV